MPGPSHTSASHRIRSPRRRSPRRLVVLAVGTLVAVGAASTPTGDAVAAAAPEVPVCEGYDHQVTGRFTADGPDRIVVSDAYDLPAGNRTGACLEFADGLEAEFEYDLYVNAERGWASTASVDGLDPVVTSADGIMRWVLRRFEGSGDFTVHHWVDPVAMFSQGGHGTNPADASFITERAVRSECRVDGGDWSPCTSPVTLWDLRLGTHTFEIRAVASTGRVQTVPDLWEFDQHLHLGSAYFQDVMRRNQFDRSIGLLRSAGIVRGCDPPENVRFCPVNHVTRGEVAVMLARVLDLPSSSEDRFVDIRGGFYEPAVRAIAASEIASGCNPPRNDRFCPTAVLTRGEMAVLLQRALRLPATDGTHFVDDDGTFYEAAAQALAGAGITHGCNPPDNDRFCGDDAVTREQLAAFIDRTDVLDGGAAWPIGG